MAYTSVIPVHRLDNAIDYTLDEKKCSRRENEESLEGEIDKALNKDKTEQDLFQSAIGCTVDSAVEDMCRIKEICRWRGFPGTGPSNRAGICGSAARRALSGGGQHPSQHQMRPQPHCMEFRVHENRQEIPQQ